MRKTQAEIMTDYYHGRFAEDCHQHGMQVYIEPYVTGNFDEVPAGACQPARGICPHRRVGDF